MCQLNGNLFAKVGVIGRPEKDGQTNVWYTILNASGQIDLTPLEYDHQCLVAEVQNEDLPLEFVETVRTGWCGQPVWIFCL